jgi:hypothetical protein
MAGKFSIGHFLDPLGITPVGKGKGGGLKNFWDPASLATGDKKSSPAAATPAVAPAVAPMSAAAAEVQQSAQDLRRQSLKKRGFTSTIFAGDNGGWLSTPSPAGVIGSKSTISGSSKLGGS